VPDQEFVIGGYTAPKGSRVGLGALLVGYHQGGDLVYAGKVGTGFDDATLRGLHKRLSAIERDDPPFTRGVVREPGARWVRPELVAQVAFTEK
jgi:bifunctional non-homologous end joining protein LigD